MDITLYEIAKKSHARTDEKGDDQKHDFEDED
jgi:hypothetical protein